MVTLASLLFISLIVLYALQTWRNNSSVDLVFTRGRKKVQKNLIVTIIFSFRGLGTDRLQNPEMKIAWQFGKKFSLPNRLYFPH